MNKIHRLVWSARTGCWVAVAETARARGKGGRRAAGKTLRAAMLASGFAVAPALAEPPASVVPVGGNANAYVSPNGVPVVNIGTANASGLSHNTYTRYDVELKGLVLNNGNRSEMARQSQLAGQVPANLNLVNEASVILNEVVSTNRSTLAGFTEVVGGRADVIVANPNGITCNGCGFINTDRVTLTTGSSDIGGDGALIGFTVNRGDVLIEGLGANASTQQVFDLVARSVKLDGNINTHANGSLGIVAGNNAWNYAGRNVAGSAAGSGPAPAYAVDSSVLGGMYAGRIRIIATEAGVGVRALGEAAASADDFTLTSAGKIEIRSAASAARDLAVTSTAASGSQDVFLDGAGARLSASRNLALSAAAGQVRLADGALYAANDLTLGAATLSDVSSSGSTRFAGGASTLVTTGAATIDGSVWGAGGALAGSFDSLSVGAGGAKIHAGSTLDLTTLGNLALANAAVRSAGNLTLTSNAGAIGTGAGTGQGVQSTAGNLTLAAAGGLNNAGTVTADAGSVAVRVNGSVINSGTLHAGTTLDIADASNGGSESLVNSGTLIADGALVLKASSVANQAGATVQGASGTTLAANTLNNAGTFIASNTVGQSGTLTLASLTNSGTLQSNGGLALNLSDALGNSGSLLAAGALTLRGTDGAYAVNNTGRMQSGGLMDIKGQGGGRGVNVGVGTGGVMLGDGMDLNAGTLTVNNGGMVSSAGGMTLGLDTLSFGGTNSRIVAATSGSGTATISLSNGFSNPGAIHSGDRLIFDAPWISNSSTGGISALGALNLNAKSGNLDNYGALYAGSQLNAGAAVDFTNHSGATLDANGSMALSAGSTFTNNHAINALQDILVVAPTFRNEIPGGVPTRVWSAVAWGPANQVHYWYEYDSLIPSIKYDEKWYYEKYGSRSQSFDTPLPAVKPQMIAGRNLSIAGFNAGYNTGGVLAANSGTLTLTGTGSFTNDDLSLQSESIVATWHDWKDWKLTGSDWHFGQAYTEVTTPTTHFNAGAGIFAKQIDATGFALFNKGSTWAPTTTARSAGGATAVGGANAISFGGLAITLPANPNGYFVVSQAPGSRYLIETNPLFAVGSGFVGSDYMLEHYGYDPDTVMKRLGDANYEAYLVRQQLIAETGNVILGGYANEAEQMKRLMEQAIDESARQGFAFGAALTPGQIAALQEDVVWMVETTVAGQKVLAPVVYLAASTRDAIQTGAVIAGKDVKLDVTSLTNTGGTISGSGSLDVVSQGDITNTSGTLAGGDVSLKSTEGSIRNETATAGSGNDQQYATTIGKTGSIASTGNLELDAGQDIAVVGGEVRAGGDAALSAGGNIRFDTVVDKTTTTTGSGQHISSTTTEKNLGSTLETGGNLTLKSGGDTTIAGSAVKVGGDLDVDTGGDFNVLARQDKTTTHSVSQESGMGVGGGVYGTETTTTDSFKGTNVGSTFTVGGDAAVKSEGSMTLQGSDMTIGGDAAIDARKGIAILDGLDEERTTTRTETTTFLKMENAGETGTHAGADSQATSGQTYANADASAGAGAEASGSSDLKLSETTTTTTRSGSNTSVSSNLTVGGKLKASTEGTLTVQGSNVESGGDMELDANRIEVLTGRNETWSTTETTRVSTGLFNEGSASAEAGAEAQARAGTAGTDASASAGARAEGSGTSTLGVKIEEEETTSYRLTNTGSTLKSGGDMTIKAAEDARFVGAEVESGGDMRIEAKNILNEAAQDIEINTSSRTTHTTGIYVDADASAEAKASADVGKIDIGGDPANAEAGAEAEANASAGLRYKNEQESSVEGSVTQVTSSFKSGGSITRKAEDTIIDQGTQIEAGGNINQEAREIRDVAVYDSTFSSTDTSSHDARLGVGAGASASAGADARDGAEVDVGAGAGFRAKYEGTIDSESESSATAVTTRYKAGGSINSTSQEQTTLIGTQFEAGGDVNIEAGSLDYKAAQDTTSRSSGSQEINAELKVDVVGKAGGSLEAGYANEGSSESTGTARTGGINAGGNLTIKTRGDASFEGTQIEAGDRAEISAGGSVDFKAAHDTSESRSSNIDASLELSASKSSKGGSASGGYAQEASSSSTAQAGSIKAGGGGISISAGKDANFEGSVLDSSGDTAIEAGGNVNLKAAQDTSTRSGFSVEASVGGGKGSDGSSSGEGSIGGGAHYADKVESTGTSINSGGSVTIKGGNVVNQEASIQSQEGTQVSGKLIQQKAADRDISVGIELSVSGKGEK